MDPQLSYAHKTALNRRIANPFFNYLTADKFPGQLRNLRQITVADLLKPYPQYSQVSHTNTPGIHERYHALQMRVQRPFANGFNFLSSYNYNRESQEEFFNIDEEFLGTFRYERVPRPQHRMSIAGVYEFPFGRGRRYLPNLPAVAEAMVGGWTASAIYFYNSGAPLRFDQMDVVGDPPIDNPDKWGLMFNPAAFRQSPAFTPRINPKWFPGIVGPGYKNLDLTLAKFFQLTERFKMELKMEACNVSNTFTPDNPEMGVTRSNFGRTFQQLRGTTGREFQYNLKLHF